MEDLANILIQGGAVGICISLIFYLWKRDKMFNKTLNNHLEHTESSRLLMDQSNKKLIQALGKLTGVIAGCKNNKLNR